jgi:hypothetical protein
MVLLIQWSHDVFVVKFDIISMYAIRVSLDTKHINFKIHGFYLLLYASLNLKPI